MALLLGPAVWLFGLYSSIVDFAPSIGGMGVNSSWVRLQAAIGLAQLQRLDDLFAKRRAMTLRYSSRLSSLSGLDLPQEIDGCRHNFHSDMVRLRKRWSNESG
jgi:dTDP-4-amino-4,6-dideoxygalactose transaminase